MFWKKELIYGIIVLDSYVFMVKRNYHRQSSSARSKNMDWKSRIWNSNIFSAILIVLLIASFIKVSQEVLLRYEINQEISTLENKLSDLQGKTEKMDKLVSYLKTDDYIEKEARTKLNLSKPGEKQINIANLEMGEEYYFDKDDRSNFNKWFDYFFD